MAQSTWELLEGQGWIAPDGSYVPCSHDSHLYAALDILKDEYGIDSDDAIDELRAKGWVMVHRDFALGPWSLAGKLLPTTQAQVDRARWILEQIHDEENAEQFKRSIGMLVQMLGQ